MQLISYHDALRQPRIQLQTFLGDPKTLMSTDTLLGFSLFFLPTCIHPGKAEV